MERPPSTSLPGPLQPGGRAQRLRVAAANYLDADGQAMHRSGYHGRRLMGGVEGSGEARERLSHLGSRLDRWRHDGGRGEDEGVDLTQRLVGRRAKLPAFGEGLLVFVRRDFEATADETEDVVAVLLR